MTQSVFCAAAATYTSHAINVSQELVTKDKEIVELEKKERSLLNQIKELNKAITTTAESNPSKHHEKKYRNRDYCLQNFPQVALARQRTLVPHYGALFSSSSSIVA